MVTVYVGGKRVGPWAEAEAAVAAAIARAEPVELRDDTGRAVTAAPPVDEPDWVKEITPEETARRMAEPGLTWDEAKKRMGWE